MKESDIRPADLFDEYLRLSAQDAETYFPAEDREAVNCVGCGSPRHEPVFKKSGFHYCECRDCGSLYLSPRPSLEQFERFYYDSPSSNFWANRFFPALMENRRHLIFQPRAQKIGEFCASRGVQPRVVMDVGAGYGLFLDEWRKLHPESHLCAVEPSQALAAICRQKGIETLETISENATAWANRADLLTCFEVIEHAHTPLSFVQSLHRLVKPGGYALVSGLGVDGFDIQVLWERSKSVSPPHHINFMSVQGLTELFHRAGFVDIEVTTPGKLDIDIVRNMANVDGDLLKSHRFIRTLLSRGQEAMEDFQALLAKHRMSSHVWVFARKASSSS